MEGYRFKIKIMKKFFTIFLFLNFVICKNLYALEISKFDLSFNDEIEKVVSLLSKGEFFRIYEDDLWLKRDKFNNKTYKGFEGLDTKIYSEISHNPKVIKVINRVLNENGLLVVSFPNEGGIAWGMGRYLTTRRFVHKNTQINYDKIICFEHPNYVDNIISSIKASNFKIISRKSYPLGNLMPLDLNLVTSLIIKKRSDIT